MKWHSDQVTEALGELEAPVRRVADAGEANWIKSYTTLSTLNWAAGQGAQQTAALVKALLKRLQNDEPLPEALAALAGQQTADHLLGMPLAADVALSVDDKQQVQVSAQRWQWHNNGWQLIEPPRVVLQLKAQDTHRLFLQKSPGISTAQDFVVLDSWPSVERTPENNVWIHADKP